MKASEEKSFYSSIQFIIGLCLIISSVIFSLAFYSSRISTDSISVTGSASQEVVSDNAKFSGDYSRIVKLSALKTGYDQMAIQLTHFVWGKLNQK